MNEQEKKAILAIAETLEKMAEVIAKVAEGMPVNVSVEDLWAGVNEMQKEVAALWE